MSDKTATRMVASFGLHQYSNTSGSMPAV